MAKRLITNLAQYLEDQSIGTGGTDLFIGRMPEVDDCVLLDQTGGIEPDKYLPITKPTIQVTVRNTDYTDGFDKLKTIYDLLHQNNDTLVLEAGGVDVMIVNALNEPSHIGEDENSRHLWTCTFVFNLRD
jgi:hypothetical protein